jgi:hypothetical protein
VQGFGLFDYSGSPKSTYYAFTAFRQMLETPRRAEARGAIHGKVAILAGTDAAQTRAAVLVSNFNHASNIFELAWSALPWNGPTAYRVSRVDTKPSLAQTERDTIGPEVRSLQFRLPAPGVALIQLEPGKALP